MRSNLYHFRDFSSGMDNLERYREIVPDYEPFVSVQSDFCLLASASTPSR